MTELNQEYFVYRLVDPVEIYKVLYVGITTDVFRRYVEHLQDITKDTPKGEMLRSMRDRGVLPYMQTIENVFGLENAREREAYWINFYLELNMPLVNANIPIIIKPPTINVGVSRVRLVKPIDIKDTIKQLHREGMPHGKIAYKVGLYGRKYKVYQELCKELGIEIKKSHLA